MKEQLIEIKLVITNKQLSLILDGLSRSSDDAIDLSKKVNSLDSELSKMLVEESIKIENLKDIIANKTFKKYL